MHRTRLVGSYQKQYRLHLLLSKCSVPIHVRTQRPEFPFALIAAVTHLFASPRRNTAAAVHQIRAFVPTRCCCLRHLELLLCTRYLLYRYVSSLASPLLFSFQGVPRGSQDPGLGLPTHAGGDSDPHAVLRLGGRRVVERLQGLAGGPVTKLGGGRAGLPRMTDRVRRLLDDLRQASHTELTNQHARNRPFG